MKSDRGFTLIELMVSIGILLILVAIAFPAFHTMRANADSTACLSNLRQIGIGLSGYLSENDQVMPTMNAGRLLKSEEVDVMDTVLLPYIKELKVFACPTDKNRAKQSGSSYYWNSALNGQRAGSLNFLNVADGQSKVPLMSDKEGWHINKKKVNFLYADGHVSKDLILFSDDE